MNLIVAKPWRLSVGRIIAVSSVVAAAFTFGSIGSRLDHFAAAASLARPPHVPNLALFAAQSPVIQAHVLAALAAVGLGAFMMLSRKGARFHRTAGWVWAGLMVTVALSSFFIFNLNHGHPSFLHSFSGWILIVIPLAVLAARRHYVLRHRVLMMFTFYGSLLVSGALAFLPGRLMWRLFFG
jgi:uncharacterized membrane protein